ncbi:uncharacterized protein FIBRA_09001 [Fibroporia radiculosa]|uniref:Uncharacterized protein n=1 Tax=Fibroporia radiculosa TaxID=599839 RepID=J4ICN3_9APHY|nr:uncharacterized protein FIBRA_09001 [Fibroporia radiculosa]CCM06711.1 predicted protein [Fibroporia radiculosa]
MSSWTLSAMGVGVHMQDQGGNGLEGAARSRRSPSEIEEELTLDSVLTTVGEAIGSSSISPVPSTYSRESSSCSLGSSMPLARPKKSGQR